jgi:preflagellin peptidase FlaK
MALTIEIFSTVEYSAILVSIFFFGLGSFYDLKAREVDDWVWLAYGFVGAPLTIVRLYLHPTLLLLTTVSIVITLVVSLGLFYAGLFGGADAKAIICLGVTIPLAPMSFQSLLGYLHPFFPITVAVMAFVCSVSIVVYYGGRNSIAYARNGRRMFEGMTKEPLGKKILASMTGYRTDISRLKSTFYLYPMEEVDPNNAHRRFKLFFGAEADRDRMVSEFTNSLSRLGYEGKVWVTPGLPMLLFVLIGLIITLGFGDVIFSGVMLLAGR